MQTLFANAEDAVRASGGAAQVEKVESLQEIMKFGVITTPALVVDGKVQSVGRVLSADEIAKLLV